MGKAARLRRERRAQAATHGPDPHLPDPGQKVADWGVALAPGAPPDDPGRSSRVVPSRRADFWRALPGKRVACDLCYRACELAPGQAGWCRIRENRGGALRLTSHGVVAVAMRRRLVRHLHHRCGLSVVSFGTTSCTARCSFCTATTIAWEPERLPWAYGERAPITEGELAYHRAVCHPRAAVELVRRRGPEGQSGARGVDFAVSESTLTLEWSFDTARLAKAAGLNVSLDTNGFTAPAAIAALAPFVDSVYLSFKGLLNEDFYAHRMRSPGAVPHVRAAARAWKAAGVALAIGDVVPPPRWMGDAEATESARRTAAWIAANLGPDTIYCPHEMVRNAKVTEVEQPTGPMLPAGAGRADLVAFAERVDLVHATARAEGLHYVTGAQHPVLTCRGCGGVILADVYGPLELHAADGRCGHCGAGVPLVTIDGAEHAALLAERAADADAA